MAINIEIRVDTSGLSQKAIENAVAARAAQFKQEEEAKIQREALQAYRKELEEKRKDTKGIKDLPTWDPNPPRLELSNYVIKQKNWNMLWWRTEVVPENRRMRAYLSNSQGTSFREFNLDWAMESSTLPINGDPKSPPNNEIPFPSDYLESFLPSWVELKNLHKVDDLPPLTHFFPPRIVAGSSYDGFSLATELDNWIYNPRFMSLSLLYTGPFCAVQRVLWEKIRDYGSVRLAILPLVDDIAVAVVYTETVVKTRAIDFYRIKQGGGTIAANSPRNVTISSVDMYSKSFRKNGGQGTKETPVWEFLIGRIPGGFGQIKYVNARMSPRNPAGEQIAAGSASIGLDNFDQTHSIQFQLCTSSSFAQHYREYYPKKDYRTQQAEPYEKKLDENGNEIPREWAPCKFISVPLWIGTDPRVYHPSPYLPEGQVNTCDGTSYDLSKRGWDDTEFYTEQFYNFLDNTTTNKRVYRGWSKTYYELDPGETLPQGYVPTQFETVNEGDYLFVRINEIGWNNNGPYCTSQYGTTRIAPYAIDPESAEDPEDRRKGNYLSPQQWTESLYLYIGLKDGSVLQVSLPGYTTQAYQETAHVMSDIELLSLHNDPDSVEPNVRTFVVSDLGLEEIECPEKLKTEIKKGRLFNRLKQEDEGYFPANIIEGENEQNISYGDYADPIYHGKYGAIPGKNWLTEGHDKMLDAWYPFGTLPAGWVLTDEYDEPPIHVSSTYPGAVDGKSSYAFLPHPPRDVLYDLGSNGFKSYMESNPVNLLDYKIAQPALGKRYIFSIYVRVISIEDGDGGIYPEESKDCQTKDENFANPPGRALVCLQQVNRKADKFFLSEYTVQEVEIGSWYRIWMTCKIKGGDRFRIDNWTGDHLSTLKMEVFGPQLETTEKEKETDEPKNDKPTTYEPRDQYLQVYRSGVYTDAVAKANSYQVIGQESRRWYYDENEVPLDKDFLKLGIGFESIFQQVNGKTIDARSPVDDLGSRQSYPTNQGQPDKFSPAVYESLGVDQAGSVGANGNNGGGGGGAGTRCSIGAPSFDNGPVADRKNETFVPFVVPPPEGAPTFWNKTHKLMGEQIKEGKINASYNNDYAGLNNSEGRLRASSNTCPKPSWPAYGNLDAQDESYSINGDKDFDADRKTLSTCSYQGYGSSNAVYIDSTGEANGMVSGGAQPYACDSLGGGFTGGGVTGGGVTGSGVTGGIFNPSTNAPYKSDNEELDRQSCEFKLDKAQKMKGFLKNQRYHISELLLRGDIKSLPGVIQYSSWGELEKNAKSLEELGFDPEIVLGIGAGAEDPDDNN
jgi:hypothetical protein